MKLIYLIWFVWLFYGLIFLLPLKIKIFKKHGSNTSYDDMIKLAENGDADVIKLRRRTKFMLALVIVGVLLYLALNIFKRH
jgi:uncharacterized protein YqhQ